MNSGVSLQQMLTEVKRQSESKEDYLIAPNRLRMESYGKEMFLHLSDDSGTELIEPMTITGIAHRQIGTHLRIPAAYYDRMREERPDLLAYNANTWFKQESSQRMLRTLDGSARAYLSNRYRRMQLPLSLATICPFSRCISVSSVLTLVSTCCFCSCKRRYRSMVADRSLSSSIAGIVLSATPKRRHRLSRIRLPSSV